MKIREKLSYFVVPRIYSLKLQHKIYSPSFHCQTCSAVHLPVSDADIKTIPTVTLKHANATPSLALWQFYINRKPAGHEAK